MRKVFILLILSCFALMSACASSAQHKPKDDSSYHRAIQRSNEAHSQLGQ